MLILDTDRDSKQWKLDEKSVQRRRNLFWEIFILDVLHVGVVNSTVVQTSLPSPVLGTRTSSHLSARLYRL